MAGLRRRIAILLIIALMLLLGGAVCADETMNLGNIMVDFDMSPFDYDEPPEGYEVFIYKGYNTCISAEIDLSSCVVGRLYVYNSTANSLVEISTQIVSICTPTLDALYYVTETQAVYKTDYLGTSHQLLYQSSTGTISGLASYYNLLYFIENGSQIVLLDATTGSSVMILTYPGLDWLFMLNEAEMLFVTMEEDCYIYNLFTRDIIQLSGMMEATARINQAVLGETEADTPDVSIMATYTPSLVTQTNDVTLPLSDYPVRYFDYVEPTSSNFWYNEPISWYHVNKEEGCSLANCETYAGTSECEAFAMEVHDIYMHMKDVNAAGTNEWSTYRHRNAYYYGDTSNRKELDSKDAARSFFANKTTGTYIRYGKYFPRDSTPENGCHSVVFLARDTDGIWVYECNQDYHPGNDDAYYGCGVFLQYYTYDEIDRVYDFILYYVEHTYSNICENTSTHKAQCTQCVGYLRQPHTSGITIKSTNQHGYACCTGGESNHTGTATYQRESSSKHRVSYSCCSGSILEEHTFNNAPIRKCLICGQVMEGGIMEPITPTMLPPAEVTLTE